MTPTTAHICNLVDEAFEDLYVNVWARELDSVPVVRVTVEANGLEVDRDIDLAALRAVADTDSVIRAHGRELRARWNREQ